MEEKRDIIVVEDDRGTYVVNKPKNGTLPQIGVYANNVPAAWELAVLSCLHHGIKIHTHYDKKDESGNFIDPPSIEAKIEVNIINPFNEPRIHRNFPGGPEELEVYRQEVVEGIHDHWINPKENKWTYTYHERLFNYNPSTDLKAENRGLLLRKGINQIEKIVDDLERDITSKGAQATTWMPTADPGLESNRPCLQRLWFRPLPIDEDENKGYSLNLNTYWRSRDLYKAWFMNVYAITDLQRKIAGMLSERIKKPVVAGEYSDTSDSLHLYGAYWKEEDFRIEIEKMENEDIEKRVWSSDNPAFSLITEQTREQLKQDVDYMKKTRKL